jgi:hypothetical protein
MDSFLWFLILTLTTNKLVLLTSLLNDFGQAGYFFRNTKDANNPNPSKAGLVG